MTASQNPRIGGRDPAEEPLDGTPATPGSDMQREDAGTADSGGKSRANEVESAQKQTSKTGREAGDGQQKAS